MERAECFNLASCQWPFGLVGCNFWFVKAYFKPLQSFFEIMRWPLVALYSKPPATTAHFTVPTWIPAGEE